MRHLVLVLGLLAGTSAYAGQSCEPRPFHEDESLNAAQLASKVTQAVERSGDDVLVIARVGQDLSKYGVHFSHMGFLVKDHPKGKWTVVHALNECGTNSSALYDEGLVNFFSDTPFKYEAGLWHLKPEMQERLKKVLLSRKVGDFHSKQYSMVAYPFSTKYQNSNGWALEVMAYTLAPEFEADTRSSAQQWLKATGYVPTTLELGAMTRLGARMTKANVAFDDHPDEFRWNGIIKTVTVKSAVSWLQKMNACAQTDCPVERLTLEGNEGI